MEGAGGQAHPKKVPRGEGGGRASHPVCPGTWLGRVPSAEDGRGGGDVLYSKILPHSIWGPQVGGSPRPPPSPAERPRSLIAGRGQNLRREGPSPLHPPALPHSASPGMDLQAQPHFLEPHPCPDLTSSSLPRSPTCPVPGIFLKHRSDHRALSSAPFLKPNHPGCGISPHPSPPTPPPALLTPSSSPTHCGFISHLLTFALLCLSAASPLSGGHGIAL